MNEKVARGTVYGWFMDELRKGDERCPLYDWVFAMQQFKWMYQNWDAPFLIANV